MSLVARIGFACLLVTAVSGCRSLRERESDFSRMLNEPAPVPENVRASFGTMGVVTSGDLSQFAFGQPQNFSTVFGSVAARSFNKLDEHSFDEDMDFRNEAGRILFISAASLTAGVLGGVFNSVPESELRRGRRILAEALKAEPLERGIKDQLLDQAESRQILKFRPIPAALLEQLQPTGSTNLNLPVLVGQGFDSVLVIKLEQYGFAARGSGNPPLAFAALVDVDVLRVGDGHLLHTGPLIYRSRQRHFNHWVAQDAGLFRDELAEARRLYAEVMLDQLFGSPQSAAGAMTK